MLQSLQIWLLLAGLHMFSLAVHLLTTPSFHWCTTNLVRLTSCQYGTSVSVKSLQNNAQLGIYTST